VKLLKPGVGVDPAQARAMLDNVGQCAQAIWARGGETPKGLDALLAIVPAS